MTDQIDQTREDQIKKAGDNIYFAWAGGEEPGQGHYYRIQSPSFLVEIRQHAGPRQSHSLRLARL